MRTFLAFLLSSFGRLLVPLMRYVPDLPDAERIGVDRPKFFERVLMKVFRYREIKTEVSGQVTLYLRRFFLTPRKWPFRVFLHHIVRSDSVREAPHDHPFDFSTTLLSGNYVEAIDVHHWNPDGTYVPENVRTGVAGMTFDNPAEHVHKLFLGSPMWTLVLVSRARRPWGFITSKGWVGWRKYLGLPDDEAESLEDM